MTRFPRPSLPGTSSRSVAVAVTLPVVAAALVTTPAAPAAAASTYLQVSTSADRSGGVPLDGRTLTGKVYVFVPVVAGGTTASFWVDDPAAKGKPAQVESSAPWDLEGGAATAKPWDLRSFPSGQHTITVRFSVDGKEVTETASVTVVSPVPAAPAAPAPAAPAPAVPAAPAPAPAGASAPTASAPAASAPAASAPAASVPAASVPPAAPTTAVESLAAAAVVPAGYPSASNTGVPKGTKLTKSGGITVTKAGTVIDALDVSGSINVKANNVTIRRSRIVNGGANYPVRLFSGFSGLVVEDTEINGNGNASVGICCNKFTLRRVNLHNSVDGVRADGNVVVEDSWIHDLARTPGSHNDTIQTLKGSNIVIRRNTLLPYDAAAGDPHNAAFIISAGTSGGAVDDVLLEKNYVNGGNYTLYLGKGGVHPVTDVTVRGNRFGRNFRFGPVTALGADTTFDATNVWNDTNLPVR
ncbi:right-handed parallel beta-helix repeat-containing protein [Motilibacter aurantiacus]|uniref:right-handed parallel beta-helix repeat-containing protein n=1 Tax=Motilibacter aurantiacus TaxID=2714955 RepID=UPI00140B866F|nr:right-handed parallel beta-helix repeat-containing protein [Motilibacter aurantiacus]NHC45877.1 hypothetical protein [Motilibacter aurantiacus]